MTRQRHTAWSPNLRAVTALAKHLRETDPDFTSQWASGAWTEPLSPIGKHLGVTGGDHQIRDRKGRIWSVDLVLGKVRGHRTPLAWVL